MKWFVATSGNIGSGKSTLTTYEDAEIFARTLYLQGLMDERDFRAYHDLYQTMLEFLRPPDLVVYLRAPVEVLLARFDLCPVMTVEAAEVSLDRLDEVIGRMQDHLPSLFPLAEPPP